MTKPLKAHKAVAEDYLATAKQSSVVHRFPFPPGMVWNALLDAQAWTQWLPITKVTWTSPKPFGPGTTRTVEVGPQVIEETFFAWEEGTRMAFRFERSSLPDCLEITAETAEGEIMGLQHKQFAVHGVQFHPESIATEGGMRILQNFLALN